MKTFGTRASLNGMVRLESPVIALKTCTRAPNGPARILLCVLGRAGFSAFDVAHFVDLRKHTARLGSLYCLKEPEPVLNGAWS